MFQTMALQWQLRKNFVYFGAGLGLLYYGDHLMVPRFTTYLESIGMIHNRPLFTGIKPVHKDDQ